MSNTKHWRIMILAFIVLLAVWTTIKAERSCLVYLPSLAKNSPCLEIGFILPSCDDFVVKYYLWVVVRVWPPQEVHRVLARIEDREVELTPFEWSGPYDPAWQGTLSLVGLTPGPKLLTVIAIDKAGQSTRTSRYIKYVVPD